MIRLTTSCERRRGGNVTTASGLRSFAMVEHFRKTPAPENGAEVDRTACGPGAGRGRVRGGVHRHVRQDLSPAIPVPRIPRADMDDRPGLADPDAACRH